MDKEKILAALYAIQNGEGAGPYHDELETLITLVINAADKDIAVAWEKISTDSQETE